MPLHDPEFKRPVPRCRLCEWYEEGTTSRPPKTAIVTGWQDEEGGVLNLAVFGGGPTTRPVYGCRHRDDPYLEKRPLNAKENGSWDYLPVERSAASGDAEKPPATRSTKTAKK